jgi:hypothetical protein
VPAAKLEPAGDPAADGVAAADVAFLVMQAAAVAVDEPALGRGDQLAEWRHPVLSRHMHLVIAVRVKTRADVRLTEPRD